MTKDLKEVREKALKYLEEEHSGWGKSMYKGPGVDSMFGTLEKGGQCDWSRVSVW